MTEAIPWAALSQNQSHRLVLVKGSKPEPEKQQQKIRTRNRNLNHSWCQVHEFEH